LLFAVFLVIYLTNAIQGQSNTNAYYWSGVYSVTSNPCSSDGCCIVGNMISESSGDSLSISVTIQCQTASPQTFLAAISYVPPGNTIYLSSQGVSIEFIRNGATYTMVSPYGTNSYTFSCVSGPCTSTPNAVSSLFPSFLVTVGAFSVATVFIL
jgi:hypothetical protein